MTRSSAVTAAEAVLERLSGKVDEAEVYEARNDSLEVELKNGKPRSALARETSGVAVRAIKAGRLGFAGATDRTPRGEERLVENVLSSLALGDEVGFSFPGAVRASTGDLATHDPAAARLGPRELIELANEALAALKSEHPDVVFDLSVSRSEVETRLVNSRGVSHEDRSTVVSIGVEFNRTRSDDVLLDDDSWAAPGLDPAGRRALVARVTEKLERARRHAKLARPGKLPVLFSPAGSTVVWSPLTGGLSGMTIRSGTSPVRERRGQQVLDERFTLADDPLLPGLLGSAPVDDEGLARRRNVLYERGVLRTFLHDLRTAAATKQEPTASGERAGIFGAPSPGFSNVTIEPGDRPASELLRGIDYGLLVESVIGMGQGNTLSGAFSNVVGLAYLVEKGEVVGRVKDVSIAGNSYELFAPGGGLLALSRERETVHGSRVVPWFLVALNVVGKGA